MEIKLFEWWKCALIYVSGGTAEEVGHPTVGSVSSITRQKAGELCKLMNARDGGSIDLPAGLLTLMQGRFDAQLAEAARFEAELDWVG